MGKKNKSSSKADKPKHSYQDKLKIDDLAKAILEKASQVGTMSKADEWENYTSIYALLQELQSMQKAPSLVPSEPPRLERLAALRSWLLENGGSVSGLEPAAFGALGEGLVCTEPLAEGDTAIEVPRDLMMTLETARASPLGALLVRDKVARALPQLGLTLHVLEEALNPDSRWSAYLRALPHTYTTVLYFTPEEMQQLRGSPCFDEAIKQCRNIARQYAYFHGFLNNTSALLSYCSEARALHMVNNFTYDRYRWAASTVMTRMNNIPSKSDPSQGVPGLIPFWDLCNHSNGRVSTDYLAELSASVCFASRNYSAGEQFFIFYGVRPNAEFMLHNGFVYAENEHDAVAVRLGVSRGDALHVRRTLLLERLGVPHSGLFYLHREGVPIDASLLAFLRVFNMDDEALEHWLRADNVSELGSDVCAGLAQGADRVAWQYLHTRITLLLRQYPDSAAADETALQLQLTPHLCMAAELRLGERRILQRALQYAQKMMDQ